MVSAGPPAWVMLTWYSSNAWFHESMRAESSHISSCVSCFSLLPAILEFGRSMVEEEEDSCRD